MAACIYSTYSKSQPAYDSVSHAFLIKMLLLHKLPLPTIRWTQDFLRQRTAQTQIYTMDKAIRSNKHHITRGVPQGSSLSPIIFNLFFNNASLFTDHHNKSNKQNLPVHHQRFADDKVFWINGHKPKQSQQSMQLFMDNLRTYLKQPNQLYPPNCHE